MWLPLGLIHAGAGRFPITIRASKECVTDYDDNNKPF